MAKKGDSYTVKLSKTHLEWGTYRYTNSRERIYGEAYIPIPKKIAQQFNIVNSNATGRVDILGANIYNCRSADGLFSGILKEQGSSKAGSPYAKNFSAKGNLQAIGNWLSQCNAQIGDMVSLTWINANDIEIKLL